MYASIKNIITQKEDYIFVTYKELASEPIKTVKKIFEFIEEDYIPIQTTNLKQLNVNGIEYDDSVLSKDGSWPIKLHTIKTDEVKGWKKHSKMTLNRTFNNFPSRKTRVFFFFHKM